MSEQPTIHTERVDDVPLLLAHMQRLGLPTILDAHFPAHGKHQGLSLGWLATAWLAHVLSRADHRLNRVRPWADQRTTTLNAVLPQPLRPTDLTDDRLADVLDALSDDARWAACEGALNQHILRVYDLTPRIVRAVELGVVEPGAGTPVPGAATAHGLVVGAGPGLLEAGVGELGARAVEGRGACGGGASDE